MYIDNNSNQLHNERNEKIIDLGFLCYNLYIDGAISFRELHKTVEEIRIILSNTARNNGLPIYEGVLSEKLTELGCICYSLYVDKKLINERILSLCGSISVVSDKISSNLKQGDFEQENDNEFFGFEAPDPLNYGISDLNADCPYGMEPVPVNFKKCVCGYKNKQIARFCGRCGAKLM